MEYWIDYLKLVVLQGNWKSALAIDILLWSCTSSYEFTNVARESRKCGESKRTIFISLQSKRSLVG